MLKMYHHDPHSGSTPDFWANSWDGIDFEEALKLCSSDPLLPLFDKYVKKESFILEGGCGKGHWVAYFADRGYKVVGLDFAQRTLAELGTKRDGLMLTAGNVNSLPFADDTFDVYYSGGVVEHFEAGCEDALAEARRVIKPSGTLLLSVPYYSPMRKLLTPFRRKEWRSLSHPEVDRESVFEGLTYFQYAYTIPEFVKMTEKAGLKTLETMGYSVVWGLYDLKFLLARAQAKNRSRVPRSSAQNGVGGNPQAQVSEMSLVKRLIVGESTSTSLDRAATASMRSCVANMMMYVCKKV